MTEATLRPIATLEEIVEAIVRDDLSIPDDDIIEAAARASLYLVPIESQPATITFRRDGAIVATTPANWGLILRCVLREPMRPTLEATETRSRRSPS